MNERISFTTIIAVLKKLLLLNGAFLAGMSLFRLIFYWYYRTPLQGQELHRYVVKAFVLGMRFDLVVVAYINTLVTLTLLIVWSFGRKGILAGWLSGVKYYYTCLYSLVYFLLCVDFGFYSYFKNHINILIFGIFEDDTKALFSTLSDNYNLFLVGAGFLSLFACVYLLCRYFLRLDAQQQERHLFGKRYAPGYSAILAVALVLANALAARGSFGMFPLGTMDAEISSDVFVNKLSLNGLFTLQEAIEYRMKENRDYNVMKMTGYEGKPEAAFADFLGVDAASLPHDLTASLLRSTPKNTAAERVRPNVVVIMMEGFGIDLSHYQSDRFNVLGDLKEHFDRDYLFSNFLSGDVGTIGSIETVVMNIPKRPLSKPLSQSRYAYGFHPSGAAWPFKHSGYDTIFLYGGNTGWRNVLNFMPTLGFDAFEGEGSMDPSYPRNQWGVYDEYLFDYLYGKLSSKDGKPKFIFAMTTSNHPPYSLPEGYQLLPLEVSPELEHLITGDRKLAGERFKTYQYANQKLGELITKIKNSEFGRNTIIAVTGDHNFWSVFDYPAERYPDLDGVPFYLYVPEQLRPAGPVNTSVCGSHIDIMPTLYHLALSQTQYLALGTDLLDNTVRHIAYNVDGLVMSDTEALRYSLENNSVAFYTRDTGGRRRWLPASETDEHRKLLIHYKAAIAVTDYLVRTQPADRKGP